MLGKRSGQMGFGDMEAMGWVPEGHFLKKIDGRINWRPFEKLLEPLYHPTQGRPSHPPLVMFKALLLQQWYGLSDPGLEEAICDRLSFQRFLGLSLQDPVPDETRICRFRNMLAQADLGERLFGLLEEQLDAKGLLVRRGSLIDATLVKAQPHAPRKGEASPDPEADWTRRGKDGHFGYKVHLTVDQGSDLLRRLALTPASTSESRLFEEMVIGDEAAVFADGAYAKDARKAALRSRGVICGIINRPWRYRAITAQQKKRNRFFSRVRRAVERVIGTLKCRYGLERCRYIAKVRNHNHLWLKGMCYNLRKMLVLQGAT
ncbi:MAG: IS5 family transposase [Proteobacteria bacterium]|nr:IS5 family transposase [Pseudomonadota bacterium]